jgi:hypothetical protein
MLVYHGTIDDNAVDAGAVKQSGEDVAAESIRAEAVLGGRGEQFLLKIRRVWIAWPVVVECRKKRRPACK